MLNVGVLVSGGGTNLQAVIDAIKDKRITTAKVSVVVSSNNKAYAIDRAKHNNIPYKIVNRKDYKDRSDFDKAILNIMKEYNIGLIVMAGFMCIVGKTLINAYHNRIINVHPSLIPAFCGDGYYGLKVHEKVIEYGVKVTGATVHFVNEITDGGPIILQKPVYIDDDYTPHQLQQKVMKEAEWIILPKAIELIGKGKVKVNGRKVVIEE